MLLDCILRYGMDIVRKTTLITTDPHLFSPVSAISTESKSNHYITFQCVRNASNKSIEFPDTASLLYSSRGYVL